MNRKQITFKGRVSINPRVFRLDSRYRNKKNLSKEGLLGKNLSPDFKGKI